ncbi:MAG TPA: hypothetical protein VN685_12190 [Rhizomicrobium sp.]|nr:hypothetical protein [Rhizomicrobium sp.]
MSQQNSGRGGPYRAALAAVIILSALLVAGVIALVIGFMRQYEIYRGGGRGGVAVGAAVPPAVVALEPGARIISVQTMSNRLVLQLATSKGAEVEVLDLSTGKLLYRVAAH